MNPDEGAYLGMNYYEGESDYDSLEHVREEHEDDVAATYPNRYLTDTYYAFVLYYEGNHDPTDHEHGEEG